MNEKKVTPEHTEFIRLVANGKNQSEAYMVTVGKNKVTLGTAKKNGSLLAKKYYLEIGLEKKKMADLINEVRNSEVVKGAIKNIVSQAEADEKVFRILGTEDTVEDVMIIAGKAQIVKRKPNTFEIQRSYELYCKRFGSFSPVKQAIDHTGVIRVGYGKKED